MSKLPPTFLTMRALYLETAQAGLLATALRYRAEIFRACQCSVEADMLDQAADVLQRMSDEMRDALSERGAEMSALGSPKYVRKSLVAARRSALRVVEPPTSKRRKSQTTQKGDKPA